MAHIRSKDTVPELIVRSIVFKLGYRYRLHGRVSKKVSKSGFLPGKPDIVMAGRKIVIFVNGCFWHQHPGCKRASIPKSNIEYWNKKLNKNQTRDLRNQRAIKEMGWKVIIVWECEIKDKEILKQSLVMKLNH